MPRRHGVQPPPAPPTLVARVPPSTNMAPGGAVRCVAWAGLGMMLADERRRSGAFVGLDAAARRLACVDAAAAISSREFCPRGVIGAERAALAAGARWYRWFAASEPSRIARRQFSMCASRVPKRVLQKVIAGALQLPVVQSSVGVSRSRRYTVWCTLDWTRLPCRSEKVTYE